MSETFLILRRTVRDMIQNVYRSSCKVPIIIFRFKLEYSLQIFEKCSNINFRENPFCGSWVVPCGQTWRS